jgi:hypothetical protein
LARVGERLVQLTWQEQVAHVYDLQTLEQVTTFSYVGEGWGLCFDGSRLVMSDGSDTLYFRDPDSFDLLGSRAVERDGTPVYQLNELECVDGLVLANVWMTDTIVVVDPTSGEVLMDVDASGLLAPDEAAAADVLNGIAFDPESRNYLLTGKLWPKLFEVRIDAPTQSHAEPTKPERSSSSSCSFGRASQRATPWLLGLLLVGVAARRRQAAGAQSCQVGPGIKRPALAAVGTDCLWRVSRRS